MPRAPVPLAPTLPWATLLAVALVLLLAAAPAHWQAALALQRQAVAHAPWQVWTGHLVHHGWSHAGADGLGLLLAGACVERWGGTRAWLCGSVIGLPVISLVVVAADPGLLDYRGASGWVVMFAVWAGALAAHQQLLPRPVVWLLAAALLGKLAWDAAGGGSTVLPAGVRPVPWAHAAGAGVGLLCGAVACVARRAPRNAGPAAAP